MTNKAQELILQMKVDAVDTRQRRLLIIAGSESWGCHQVGQALEALQVEQPLWVGAVGTEISEYACYPLAIAPAQANQWLGNEIDYLIINAWSGFCANAFGILSGAVREGGLLLLLSPAFDHWPFYHDPENKRIASYPQSSETITGRYLKRLVGLIRNSIDLSVIEEGGALRSQKRIDCKLNSYEDAEGCQSAEQSQAVQAVQRVATGHRRRPLVLTADRGRGKSAALGIAAASLMAQGIAKIIVTAPSIMAADAVFRHAAERLKGAKASRGLIKFQDQQLLFRAPDELAEFCESCNLLLVDEAAAIPSFLLKRLLTAYSRIVFSSTIHGYEGSGQGFSIRFSKTLDEVTPQWKKRWLHAPVRWSENDPLERFTSAALMLNASPVDGNILRKLAWRQASCEIVNRDDLASNEPLLVELFGLLVLAHYKTTPFDLRHLLDGNNISIYVVRVEGHVLAAALVAREGDIDTALTNSIWLGKRRVQGHLLPQSLSYHVGIAQAVTLKAGRIVRMAVHPQFQREGLGQRLTDAISRDLSDRGVDYFGCLFGATPELLDFWSSTGLMPVRMGVTREASSGTYSAMLLKPLSEQGATLFDTARGCYFRQFLHLLPCTFNRLDADVAVRLLKGREAVSLLNADEWRDIESFAGGERLYESCIASIKKLVLIALTDPLWSCALVGKEKGMLLGKVLQNHSWELTSQLQGFSGKTKAVKHMKSLIARLIDFFDKK